MKPSPHVVCILGGSLSALECARQLAKAGLEVELFRRLHDPSRSFHDLHPFYEYSPRSLVVPPEGSPLLSAAVESWLSAGFLVDDSPKTGGCRAGRLVAAIDGQGPATFEESPPWRRVRGADAKGFFGLLDSLAGALPPNCKDRREVVAGLAASKQHWMLSDLEGAKLGDYDAIICSYDCFLKATRKAALRALLEEVLPVSAPIMRAVAGSVDSCAFALAAKIPDASTLPFDVASVEGVPELALIVRNQPDPDAVRGLPQEEESWTLVATPEWTKSVRPDAQSHWNKNDVSAKLLQTFSNLSGCLAGHGLRPPYHWGGFTSLTKSAAPFAYDSVAGIAFVGDFFAGHGAEEALTSGAALAAHLLVSASVSSSKSPENVAAPLSVLQELENWVARPPPSAMDEDTARLRGPAAVTEDHAWPTVGQLATGRLTKGQRCMHRYQRRGVRKLDLEWLSQVRAGFDDGRGLVRDGKGERRKGRGTRGGTGKQSDDPAVMFVAATAGTAAATHAVSSSALEGVPKRWGRGNRGNGK